MSATSATVTPSPTSLMRAPEDVELNSHPQPHSFPYRTNVQLIQRRGSMPCDSLTAVFAHRHPNNGSINAGIGGGSVGKSRSTTSSRKKLLRRRSAGGCGSGADILAPIFSGDPLDHGSGVIDCGSVSGGGGLGDDVTCFNEEILGSNNLCDETGLLETSTGNFGSARFRLKRGSEATLSRSGVSHSQRNEMEAMLSRRRGSLPVEMLSISCSG